MEVYRNTIINNKQNETVYFIVGRGPDGAPIGNSPALPSTLTELPSHIYGIPSALVQPTAVHSSRCEFAFSPLLRNNFEPLTSRSVLNNDIKFPKSKGQSCCSVSISLVKSLYVKSYVIISLQSVVAGI